MTNLPKFIRIQRAKGKVHYINVNILVEVTITDLRIQFLYPDGYEQFEGDDYQTAKAAWLEYWKTSP